MNLLIRLCVVKTDHPINAEFIRKHSKIVPQKSFIHWHGDLSSRRETIEQTVGFSFCIGIYLYGKIVPL